MIKIGSFIILLIVFFSCSNKEIFYDFDDIKSGEWNQSDTLNFVIDSSLISPDKKYDMNFEIMNNTEYLYRNLWLYIIFDSENQSKLEQREYMLADSLGKWYGSGFGSTYQLSLPFKKNFVFTEKKNYTVKIVHGMIDQPLIGIEKVGLKVQISKY